MGVNKWYDYEKQFSLNSLKRLSRLVFRKRKEEFVDVILNDSSLHHSSYIKNGRHCKENV